MNDAVAMLGRAVERIDAQRLVARVQHVVSCAGRDDDRVVILDRVARAVDDDLAFAFLDAEELVAVLVHFLADVLAGLQRHQHELQVLAGVEHAAEIVVLLRDPLDVIDKSFHRRSSIRLGRATESTRVAAGGQCRERVPLRKRDVTSVGRRFRSRPTSTPPAPAYRLACIQAAAREMRWSECWWVSSIRGRRWTRHAASSRIARFRKSASTFGPSTRACAPMCSGIAATSTEPDSSSDSSAASTAATSMPANMRRP